MKLEIDTAQFGLRNNSSYDDIQEILDYAKEIGLTSIQTAPQYVHSEEVLGQYNLQDFDVSTMIINVDYSISRHDNFENIKNSFYLSQRKLGYIELYSLMFHNANDLLSEHGLTIWDLMNDFKDKEYVYKLGVSVTTPMQLEEILDTVDIDIVQLPLNLLNQSFTGMFKELKQKDIEIHTRSTFHQGLLLKSQYQIPEYFREISSIINSIPEPKAAYALSFPKLIKEVDKITVNCENKQQLEEINDFYNYTVENIDYAQFKVNEEKFINPSIFNRLL